MNFDRYIGIDYSGAQTATSSLKGLRVYMAGRERPPVAVTPPVSPRKHWTRRGLAEWLAVRLAEDRVSLVGIDHGFSFPMAYFRQHGLALDWTEFLEDFQQHLPTDQDHTYVDFVRDGVCGSAGERWGSSRWRRLTEMRAGRAKSVFHFDVPGSVAKSTHAGLPWLRRLQKEMAGRVHFWPFDGWAIPPGRSVVAEAYPALWSMGFACEGRDAHEHDAFSIAEWMRLADRDGSLADFFSPELDEEQRSVAAIEGWILGLSDHLVQAPIFETMVRARR